MAVAGVRCASIPGGGTGVQGGFFGRIQAGAQGVGEQVVVAIPLLLVVERDEEEVGAVEVVPAWPGCRRGR